MFSRIISAPIDLRMPTVSQDQYLLIVFRCFIAKKYRGATHTSPTLKIPHSATFDLVGMRNFQKTERGSSMATTSTSRPLG